MKRLLSLILLLTFNETYAFGTSSLAIEYFNEIAMGSEFGTGDKLTRKWSHDVNVFIRGEYSPKLVSELDDVIFDLNSIISTIKIHKVSSKELANFIVYFGSAKGYAKAVALPAKKIAKLDSNYGSFYCKKNSETIKRCSMYVDTYRASPEFQLHLVREEFTQALGLMNDSTRYASSIFFSDVSYTRRFSQIDVELIQFLYSDSVVSRMSSLDVKTVAAGNTPVVALKNIEGTFYHRNYNKPVSGEVFSYHKNGQHKEKWNLANGKFEGVIESYHDNGKLKKKMNFKDGERNGLSLFYSDTGTPITKQNYKNDKRNGIADDYHENGKLKAKAKYKNGERHGPAEIYYENGVTAQKNNYKKNKLEGPREIYYETGKLKQTIKYKNGKIVGLAEHFHENGRLKQRSYFRNDKLDGTLETYYEDGKLRTKLTYKNGKLEGTAGTYHENGKLKQKSYYKNHKRSGLSEDYYENGKLKTKRTYKNGKQDGIVESYDDSGNLKGRWRYKEGELMGRVDAAESL
jgi:antitoxin component YwqK of YwqJK toxin-antitoxin module